MILGRFCPHVNFGKMAISAPEIQKNTWMVLVISKLKLTNKTNPNLKQPKPTQSLPKPNPTSAHQQIPPPPFFYPTRSNLLTFSSTSPPSIACYTTCHPQPHHSPYTFHCPHAKPYIHLSSTIQQTLFPSKS